MSLENDQKTKPLMASVYVIYDTRGVIPYFRCNIYMPRAFFSPEQQKNIPKRQYKPVYDDKEDKCIRIFEDEKAYFEFLNKKRTSKDY